MKGTGWSAVEALQVGERLIGIDDSLRSLSSATVRANWRDVFNFEVEELHLPRRPTSGLGAQQRLCDA